LSEWSRTPHTRIEAGVEPGSGRFLAGAGVRTEEAETKLDAAASEGLDNLSVEADEGATVGIILPNHVTWLHVCNQV
jgi:hypothetical protein